MGVDLGTYCDAQHKTSVFTQIINSFPDTDMHYPSNTAIKEEGH